ncbi:MAG: OmpA family protein [Planctomycetota bacterium]
MTMWKVLGVVGLAAMAAVSAAGCVPKAQYDELMTVNRAANERMDELSSEMRQLQDRNEQLQEQLARVREQMRSGAGDVGELEAANERLMAQLRDVQAKYRNLLEEEEPAPLGAILPEPLHEALEEFAQQNPDLIRYVPDRGMLKLKSDMTFPSGQYVVRSDAQDSLQRFADILQEAEAQKYHVYIAGHTDKVPVGNPETKKHSPNNWWLSAHRALAVQQVLTKAGLSPERIGAMGFGEYHPVVPYEQGEQAKQANRRVEIWIVPPDRFLTTPTDTDANEEEEQAQADKP